MICTSKENVVASTSESFQLTSTSRNHIFAERYGKFIADQLPPFGHLWKNSEKKSPCHQLHHMSSPWQPQRFLWNRTWSPDFSQRPNSQRTKLWRPPYPGGGPGCHPLVGKSWENPLDKGLHLGKSSCSMGKIQCSKWGKHMSNQPENIPAKGGRIWRPITGQHPSESENRGRKKWWKIVGGE